MAAKINLPQLPLNEWKDSKMTLHLILQMIGKVRLKMAPRKNHWWYITEYITPRGITTGSIPFNEGGDFLEITLNVHQSRIEILSNQNQEAFIEIKDGKSVSEIFTAFIAALSNLGCFPNIYDKPFDLGIEKSFSELKEFNRFDIDYVQRFWKILLWVDGVMKEFSGRFYGKTCPVQLYWHHMDLAVTRFSGKTAPPLDKDARVSDKDAYSHEVISFGFWAGDDIVQEPAFYSYTYPSPVGIEKSILKPEKAGWVDSNGSPMAFYTYENLLKEKDPRSTLLAFFESSYQAGAKLAKWDIEGFRAKSLTEL